MIFFIFSLILVVVYCSQKKKQRKSPQELDKDPLLKDAPVKSGVEPADSESAATVPPPAYESVAESKNPFLEQEQY